jgi:hypothetical protein
MSVGMKSSFVGGGEISLLMRSCEYTLFVSSSTTGSWRCGSFVGDTCAGSINLAACFATVNFAGSCEMVPGFKVQVHICSMLGRDKISKTRHIIWTVAIQDGTLVIRAGIISSSRTEQLSIADASQNIQSPQRPKLRSRDGHPTLYVQKISIVEFVLAFCPWLESIAALIFY